MCNYDNMDRRYMVKKIKYHKVTVLKSLAAGNTS